MTSRARQSRPAPRALTSFSVWLGHALMGTLCGALAVGLAVGLFFGVSGSAAAALVGAIIASMVALAAALAIGLPIHALFTLLGIRGPLPYLAAGALVPALYAFWIERDLPTALATGAALGALGMLCAAASWWGATTAPAPRPGHAPAAPRGPSATAGENDLAAGASTPPAGAAAQAADRAPANSASSRS